MILSLYYARNATHIPTSPATMSRNTNLPNTGSSALNSLPPELIAELSTHLPLVLRPAALLSLALTCRRLCDIIVPSVLYRAVWLEGIPRTKEILNNFLFRQPSGRSQYIQYLSFASEPFHGDFGERGSALYLFEALLDVGGLSNLMSLSIRLNSVDCGESDEIPKSFGESFFWRKLKTSCPVLKHIHIKGIEGKLTDGWGLDPGLSQSNVSIHFTPRSLLYMN